LRPTTEMSPVWSAVAVAAVRMWSIDEWIAKYREASARGD